MGASFFYPRVPFDACKPALDRPPLFASSIAVSPPIIPPSPRGRVQLLGIAQRQIRIQFRQKQARTSKAKPLPATSKQLATGFESVGQPKISPEAMWQPKWALHSCWIITRRLATTARLYPKSEIKMAGMRQEVGAETVWKNRSHTRSGLVRFFQTVYARQIDADGPF